MVLLYRVHTKIRQLCVEPFMRLVLVFLLCMPFLLTAQVKKNKNEVPFGKEGQFTFETDKPYKLLEMDEKTEEPVYTNKKKKPKKKVYYGLKTKKGFTRKGFGEKMTLELFYVLKNKEEKPPQYVKEIYYYDYARREIRRSATFDPKKGVLLHGPYQKRQGEVVLEEGIFYKGARHGRWMRYNLQNLLEDKSKYYKGWPKESLVSYYDPQHNKVKELIPVDFGEREGNYYMFHENGTLAITGEYKWNERVGDWIENYPNGKRKKIIAFPKEPFDKKFHPYIKAEYDANGREIYSNYKGQ